MLEVDVRDKLIPVRQSEVIHEGQGDAGMHLSQSGVF
jgi:hypothetical protein